MRRGVFFVTMATCLVAMVTQVEPKTPEGRSLYGRNAHYRKGKKCYQCAWSPTKLAYATLKNHYKSELSGYGQPSHTGIYHSTKKIPVSIQGGWDKCYDRFSREQADRFGIDKWECKDNCYTRTDKNGNLYRGCYKGEFNVNPNKLGCHMQAGSHYCFCEGELCNYEQGQGYNGYSKVLPKKATVSSKVKKFTAVKHKEVIHVKPKVYEYKPTYYQKYGTHHKESAYDKYADKSKYDRQDAAYSKPNNYGHYGLYSKYKKRAGGSDKAPYKHEYIKTDKYGYDKHDYGKHDKYAYESKHEKYAYDRKHDQYKYKLRDTYKHDTDKHAYTRNNVLKHGYDEYDYGKLGYVIQDTPAQVYRGHEYGSDKHGKSRKHATHAHSKYGSNRHDHHRAYKHGSRNNPKYGYVKRVSDRYNGSYKPHFGYGYQSHKHAHRHSTHRQKYKPRNSHKLEYGRHL